MYKRQILIGGTGYTGEIKKGIFTVLNYVLPQERGVLSMHLSLIHISEPTRPY